MSLNYKKTFFIYAIFTFLIFNCIACTNKTEEDLAEALNIAVSMDDYNTLRIDDSIVVSFTDETTYTQKEENSIILENSSSGNIGGIEKYIYNESSLPSLIDPDIDYFQFLNNLGLSINPDELTAHTFSTGLYNGWEIWLYSDDIDITHNLIPYNGYIYNIWFDTAKVDGELCSQILESIQFLKQ